MPKSELEERLATIKDITIDIHVAPPYRAGDEWVAGADNPQTHMFQHAMGPSANKAISCLLRVMAVHYDHYDDTPDESE
jgi:hypothetical protein